MSCLGGFLLAENCVRVNKLHQWAFFGEKGLFYASFV